MPSTRSEESLQQLVLRSLCNADDLLPHEHELSELPLARSGRVVGTQFLLHGPRSVRLGAVWDAENEVLHLFDAAGHRTERRLPRPRRRAG